MIERPSIVQDEYLTYLDDLRESGATNMYGGTSYLRTDFELNRKDAETVLIYWMESFEERHDATVP